MCMEAIINEKIFFLSYDFILKCFSIRLSVIYSMHIVERGYNPIFGFMSARRRRGSIRHSDENPTPTRQEIEGLIQSPPTGLNAPSLVWLMMDPCLSDGLSGRFNPPFVWLIWIQKLDCTIPDIVNKSSGQLKLSLVGKKFFFFPPTCREERSIFWFVFFQQGTKLLMWFVSHRNCCKCPIL